MADTNIRLLTRKIEALDPQAQHAVEVAVDSLLNGDGLAPNMIVDSRIATRERRRSDALQTRRGEVVFLDGDDGNLRSTSSVSSTRHNGRSTCSCMRRSPSTPR